MDVVGQDRKEGYMELAVESDADLWHLQHVVEPGDTLRMEDERTTIEGREKKRCRLTLTVEKTDYQGDRLRATGEITQGPEDVQHGYHTFNLEPGVTFEIWKDEWQQHQLDRVETAAATEPYEVLVCTIDTETVYMAMVTETGISELSAFDSGRSGKMYRDESTDQSAFYGQIISVFKEHTDVDKIILAGPGFEKEHLHSRITDEHPDLTELVTTEDISTVGTAGVQEVLKRGAVEQVLQQSRIADEVAAVEDLLARLNRDQGDAVYGVDRVKEAVEMGAVETLLITDAMVREEEQVMRRVEQQNGTVQLVHEDHDAGKKLASLGGIAALLRYQIE